MIKKWLAGLLIMAMLFLLFSTAALVEAADGTCGDALTYTVTGTVLTISGTGAMTDYNDGKSPFSSYQNTVSHIVIEEGVTEVSEGAFSDFNNLKYVELPRSVLHIGETAFPETPFKLFSYEDSPAGRFAVSHENITLRFKALNILCIGNSHTVDYMAWLSYLIYDMNMAGMKTQISFTRLTPMGGRKLYSTDDGGRGSHLAAGTTESDPTYGSYQEQLVGKTWDLIVLQDWHEASFGYTDFAEGMGNTVAWLKRVQPGAKIAWFADWVDKSSTNDTVSMDDVYRNITNAMHAVSLMTENRPDYIIPIATVLQNARSSYLGSTYNEENCYNNLRDQGYAQGKLQKYTVLERDQTHLSYELGRYLAGCAFITWLCDAYQDRLATAAGFAINTTSLRTLPVMTNEAEWKGWITNDILEIILESCEHALDTPDFIIPSVHTIDPARYIAGLLRNGVYDDFEDAFLHVTDANALQNAACGEAFLERLNTVCADGGYLMENAFTADDISTCYMPKIDGTVDDPDGTDGSYTIRLSYRYGYTKTMATVLHEQIPAAKLLPDGARQTTEVRRNGTVITTKATTNGVSIRAVVAPGREATASVALPEGMSSVTVVIPIDVSDGMVAVNAETGKTVMVSAAADGGMSVQLDESSDLTFSDRVVRFSDTIGHWASTDIVFAVAHGLFVGTGIDEFSPDAPMSRAMLMTVLSRSTGQEAAANEEWYEGGIRFARERGISDGDNPDGIVSREMLVTMLYRYMESPAASDCSDRFNDFCDVSDYAKDAMNWAIENRLICGIRSDCLCPQGSLTRAQTATIFARFMRFLLH